MATYFVTGHKGATEWARDRGIEAELVDHLDVTGIRPGDRVLGTLPVSIVAQVCAKGARYLHLTMEIPKNARGRELSATEMDAFGARLVEYHVREVSNGNSRE